MAYDLATVFGFLAVSGLSLLVFLLVGWLVRPKKPTPAKSATYECAEQPFGSAWFNFNNRFYIIALIFVAFDVELVLLMPVAVAFEKTIGGPLGFVAFAEMFLFLAALLVALVYAWVRGDLTWVRALRPRECVEVEVGRKEAPR